MDTPQDDTGETAEAAQREALQRMTGAQRLALAMDMSDFVRGLAVARLRREHPEWSHERIRLELLRYAFLPDPLPPFPDVQRPRP